MPKVSLIVPVYNVGRYLEDCLCSLAAQTMEDLEILLVDDGSTDHGGEICDQYAAADSRFLVFHQQNRGVSAARNFGMDKARADWICFVDSDDWVEPEMCAEAYCIALENGADIVAFGGFKEFSSRRFMTRYYSGGDHLFEGAEMEYFFLQVLYPSVSGHTPAYGVFGGPCGKLYRKNIIKKHGLHFLENLSYGEDMVFVLSFLEHVANLFYADRLWYHYRNTKESLCTGFRESWAADLKELHDSLRQSLKSFWNRPAITQAYYGRVIQGIAFLINRYYFHPQAQMKLGEKLQGLRSLLDQEPFYTALRQVDPSVLTRKHRLIWTLARRRFAAGLFVLGAINRVRLRFLKMH